MRGINTLEMQHQAVVFQRMPYAPRRRQRRERRLRGIRGRAIKAPCILAGLFSLIHGRVGARHQTIGACGIIRVYRDAATAGNPHGLPLELDAHLRDGARNAFRQNFQHLVHRIRRKNREFVTAQARKDLIAAHLTADFSRHANQRRVARAMTKRIIHMLESIQIKKQQRKPCAVALGVSAHARNFLIETPPVIKARQRIALGKLHQLRGIAPFDGHILEHPHAAQWSAERIMHGMALLGHQTAVGHRQIQFDLGAVIERHAH